MTKETENLDENSVAMDTLHPGSRPAGGDEKSKIEYISKAIGAMNAMRKDDLEKWFHDAMNLIGKEASHLPSSANEKGNEASLRAKPSNAVGNGGPSSSEPMPRLDSKNNLLSAKISVKEDVEEMFVGQDLSEEFKEKASVIFEAAIAARSAMEIARLEEEYDDRLQEEISEIADGIEDGINTYLDYVVETWMKNNEVAIESTLRNEIAEEFIGGLKNLFVEHYIDIPEEKVEVIESLASKIEVLESKLNETIDENVVLKKSVMESEKNSIFEQISSSLTLTQTEKFAALAEGVTFEGNLDSYKRKLTIVKENYFPSSKANLSNLIEEDVFERDETIETTSNDPEMNRYVRAISKTVKSRNNF
jgi:hypothetical protein